MRNAPERVCDITGIRKELEKFENIYEFGSKPEFNDIWIAVDLDDKRYEKETILHIHKIISCRYSPLRNLIYCSTCNRE